MSAWPPAATAAGTAPPLRLRPPQGFGLGGFLAGAGAPVEQRQPVPPRRAARSPLGASVCAFSLRAAVWPARLRAPEPDPSPAAAARARARQKSPRRAVKRAAHVDWSASGPAGYHAKVNQALQLLTHIGVIGNEFGGEEAAGETPLGSRRGRLPSPGLFVVMNSLRRSIIPPPPNDEPRPP